MIIRELFYPRSEPEKFWKKVVDISLINLRRIWTEVNVEIVKSETVRYGANLRLLDCKETKKRWNAIWNNTELKCIFVVRL